MSSQRITIYDYRRTRIDLLSGADLHCCRLGSMGFSSKAIADATGLSPGQVNYRLKLGKVSRAAYRNGTSLVAQKLLRYTKASLTPLIERQLIKALKAPPREKPAPEVIELAPVS
jgi:hypothetical protein